MATLCLKCGEETIMEACSKHGWKYTIKNKKPITAEDCMVDSCKCGADITWNTDQEKVKCDKCQRIYRVDCDSVLVHWLEEILDEGKPWRTDAR